MTLEQNEQDQLKVKYDGLAKTITELRFLINTKK